MYELIWSFCLLNCEVNLWSKQNCSARALVHVTAEVHVTAALGLYTITVLPSCASMARFIVEVSP